MAAKNERHTRGGGQGITSITTDETCQANVFEIPRDAHCQRLPVAFHSIVGHNKKGMVINFNAGIHEDKYFDTASGYSASVYSW